MQFSVSSVLILILLLIASSTAAPSFFRESLEEYLPEFLGGHSEVPDHKPKKPKKPKLNVKGEGFITSFGPLLQLSKLPKFGYFGGGYYAYR